MINHELSMKISHAKQQIIGIVLMLVFLIILMIYFNLCSGKMKNLSQSKKYSITAR